MSYPRKTNIEEQIIPYLPMFLKYGYLNIHILFAYLICYSGQCWKTKSKIQICSGNFLIIKNISCEELKMIFNGCLLIIFLQISWGNATSSKLQHYSRNSSFHVNILFRYCLEGSNLFIKRWIASQRSVLYFASI